jgi:hypothetical protein
MRPPVLGPSSVPARRLIAAALLAAAITSCGSGGDDALSADDGAPPWQFKVQVVPMATAIDATGTAWAVERTPDDLVAYALIDGKQSERLTLERGRGEEVGKVAMADWQGAIAAAHVVCDDDPCNSGALAVDVLRVEEGVVTADRAWTSDGIGSPSYPELVGTHEDSFTIAVGDQVLRFSDGGKVEVYTLSGQEGNACVVEGSVIAVAPIDPRAEFEGPFGPENDDGMENVEVVRLDGQRSEAIAGSRIAYDRNAGDELRCAGGRLEVSRHNQPASSVWRSSGWEVTEASVPELDWQLPSVQETTDGLLGVIDGAVVLVDSLTGSTLVSAEAPAPLAARWSATAGGPPMGLQLALGGSPTTAIACAQDSSTGSDTTGACDVF